MVISDPSETENFLLKNNYYRLNIYFHNVMDKPDHFLDGTNFEQIRGIYQNDIFLRRYCFSLLESIEIHIKTRIAYELGLKYGSDCFYNPAHCQNHNEMLLLFEREINHRLNDPVILHHQLNYDGKFPIWVIVEYLSFNSVSKYFSKLSSLDKKGIAQKAFDMNEVYLENWLHSLGILRNICAHYGFLYQRKFPVRLKLYKEFHWYTNDNLFALFLVMRFLTDPVLWKKIMEKLMILACESPYLILSDYGLPPDWRSYLLS